jgi:hypothetical protein
MSTLRAYIQRWVDGKTQEIQRLNKKCRHIVALSKEPDIRIGEFCRQVEQYLQKEGQE